MALRFARDEWLFFRTIPASDGSKVAMAIQGDDDLDTVTELTNAVGDLEDALTGSTSSGIEEKQKRNLIAASVADNYDIAKDEWKLKKQWAQADGKCELCGHNPIVYHFQIENKLNNNLMILGSSCILTYVQLAGFTREELRLYLDRLRARLKDRRFDAIDQDTLDVWDKQDTIYASMRTLMADVPRDFDIQDYERRIGAFRRIRGYQLPDHLKLWTRNISAMRGVMYDTYNTTVLHEIPDKIRRKQKIRRRKVTDEQRLTLFVEFETQLRLLLKYGSPTDAYDMILGEYRRFLEQQVDELEDKELEVERGIVAHFNNLRSGLGNRSRVKGWVDTWKEQARLCMERAFSQYEAELGDIDAMLTGTRRYFSTPSEDPSTYIRQFEYSDWMTGRPGELNLYRLLQAPTWAYRPADQWSRQVPADHPLRQVSTISSVDLKVAFLDSLDAGEVTPQTLNRNSIRASYGTVTVHAHMLMTLGTVLERLMGSSDALREAVASAKAAQLAAEQVAQAEAEKRAREEAAREQEELKKKQEFTDMIARARQYVDPNAPRETQFIDDMERKFERLEQLSYRQAGWLRALSSRSAVPSSQPAATTVAARGRAGVPRQVGRYTHPPTNGKMGLNDFLEACKETMRQGSESGFIESLIKRRRIKSWDDLSPRQQKWLGDIFVRGGHRAMPDEIIRR